MDRLNLSIIPRPSKGGLSFFVDNFSLDTRLGIRYIVYIEARRMKMYAHELTNKNKIKIEKHWYKISRVWVIGDIIEINTSIGLVRFEKNFEVEAK